MIMEFMNSESLVNFSVWNHQYFEDFAQRNFGPYPREFYHRFMYIAPSSHHSLLTLNLPFKVILRRSAVVFSCLELECCTFSKAWRKINSNPPILYYGFNTINMSVQIYWLTLYQERTFTLKKKVSDIYLSPTKASRSGIINAARLFY